MRTSPTPVDVELAVVIIAVEHEAVGSRSVAARIEEGALLVEFGTQQGAEFGIGHRKLGFIEVRELTPVFFNSYEKPIKQLDIYIDDTEVVFIVVDLAS